ncbi:hypothetical protein PEBR_21396 [Penicillium brasilianum]|uniref:Uncharacterized protein n=1 Tax=Penicillium brasilianum TaxID=104259 RepID=A0A1S9RLR5_PENBI|nr:hypothetical protein PEBR_21396 [Penicillium brasilianum]
MVPQIRLIWRNSNSTPLPYTASPLELLWSDICLVIRYAWALPTIFFPLRLGQTGPLDELYLNFQGGLSLITQAFLTVYQFLFLLSLPFTVICLVPALWIFIYIAATLTLNYAICMFVLNGFERVLVSKVPIVEQPDHQKERWLYINGIANGHYWVQDNIDQLSYTFGRKITGIHNRTAGVLFDLAECLIQRGFAYATGDVRSAYVLIKEALLDPTVEKVVLVLHSQGGIEGGLIVDWLLDELPQDLLRQLEIYTFGNAANHFNNPHCICPASTKVDDSNRNPSTRRSIGYIEHYANAEDVVSWLGVLQFANMPNRYLGRLFVRPGSGHLMNQHYLDNMFTLGSDRRVLDSNPFMDMKVETKSNITIERRGAGPGPLDDSDEPTDETLFPIANSKSLLRNGVAVDEDDTQALRVKDFSRLWQYRNGGSPARLKTE